MGSNERKARKFVRIVSLQSPEKAKKSARKLLDLYKKAGTKEEREIVVTVARKAAQKAESDAISRVYWATHDHIVSKEAPSPSIQKAPPSNESKSSSASNDTNQSDSIEKEKRSSSNETEETDGNEAVTYTIDSERGENGNADSNGNGSDDSKENGTESKSYRSDYHAFVSKEMENYSGEERRSGEAMKEIARKWDEVKEGNAS